jgi:hypothetical protein
MIEPIPVQKYKCPVCNNTIEATLDEARAHCNQVVDDPLPVGLAYAIYNKGYPRTYNDGAPQGAHMIVEDKGITISHSRMYVKISLNDSYPELTKGNLDSRDFRKKVVSGEYLIVTEKEFECLRGSLAQWYGERVLFLPTVRTTPDLEQLVSSAKK